jgi:LysR family transcriptional regulator, regulator for bpeEF and oprC
MGPVMDLWHFRRGDETVSVSVRGWLLVDNAHREIVRESAIAGAGVARLLDWSKLGGRRFNADELVPALAGWESTEVPPISALYPPSVRRIQRVKLFIDFVAQLFRDSERRTPMTTPRPHWLQSMKSRASTTRARQL